MSGSTVALSRKAKSMLIELGFKDPDTISVINQCLWLTNMEFWGHYIY